MPVEELNIPLHAQLYKQLGVMPKFGFPPDDIGLSVVAKNLTEKIMQTAMQLML